jgi:radial spoke head protein 3
MGWEGVYNFLGWCTGIEVAPMPGFHFMATNPLYLRPLHPPNHHHFSLAPPYQHSMAATMQKPSTNSTYTFASQPRAVAPQRKKYRGEDVGDGLYGNIMHDPRVIRGNTYRQQTLPTAAQPDPIELQKQQEALRRRQARQRAQDKARPRSAEPVAGRAHIEVQTELFLEELSDRVEETDLGTQTDPFLDRPPSPLYIPAKTGVDIETQIEDGELFDFDLESKPILEVLVGKTIEQSLMEVMEEEELDRLRDHQMEFEELRTAELAETQRLEEQARRRREEKERRLKQQAEVAKTERDTAEKIAARALAKSYLSGLVPSVYEVLDDGGYFYDQQQREVESVMIPWLLDGVEVELKKQTTARTILDMLIGAVVAERAAKYAPEPEPEPEVEEDKGEPSIEVEVGAGEAVPAPEGDDYAAEGEAVPAADTDEGGNGYGGDGPGDDAAPAADAPAEGGDDAPPPPADDGPAAEQVADAELAPPEAEPAADEPAAEAPAEE